MDYANKIPPPPTPSRDPTALERAATDLELRIEELYSIATRLGNEVDRLIGPLPTSACKPGEAIQKDICVVQRIENAIGALRDETNRFSNLAERIAGL